MANTHILSSKDIKREWHVIDAKGKVLGRLATKAATLLMGKNKASFVPYLDTGDYVVITNATKIKVTGKKLSQKVYTRHSGYPGGLKQESLEKLISRRPLKVIEHAVQGMLPGTKLGKTMIKKLYVFEGEEHPFSKQVNREN